MGGTIRIGRLAGIPFGVQPLWLVIVALITFSLGQEYFPDQDPRLSETAAYLLGLVSALGLFAGIVLHELGHAVVARRRGLQVDEIDLWLLGGVARIHGEPKSPRDELAYAIAGPAVTAVILAVLAAIRLLAGDALTAWAQALLDYQLYVTAAILVFNLIPAFPLDGGRVARALLWQVGGDQRRATAQAAAGGRFFGALLLTFGLFSVLSGAIGGLWFAMIGGFVLLASGAEEQGERMRRMLGERTARDAMVADPAVLASDLTLQEAVVSGFGHHLYTAFPVVDGDGRALGLVTLAEIRAVPAPLRSQTTVGAVTITDPQLRVAPDLALVELLGSPAFRRYGRIVVVDGDGRPVGLVSSTDIERRMRADELLPGTPS